jgi:hypothetical protein
MDKEKSFTHFANIDVWNRHCMITFSSHCSTSASNNEQGANFQLFKISFLDNDPNTWWPTFWYLWKIIIQLQITVTFHVYIYETWSASSCTDQKITLLQLLHISSRVQVQCNCHLHNNFICLVLQLTLGYLVKVTNCLCSKQRLINTSKAFRFLSIKMWSVYEVHWLTNETKISRRLLLLIS